MQPDWAGGHRPNMQPSCGFEHELCAKDISSQQSGIIIAGTLGVLLFCASVVTVSIYRKWKIEQEIEGLLWKIETSDLIGYYGNDVITSPSKVRHSQLNILQFKVRQKYCYSKTSLV